MTKPPSAEQYIKSRARTLPIDRCLVNADWETTQFAHVIVIRRHTNGNFTYAGYLVDLLCLGVKDTYYEFNDTEESLKQRFDAYNEHMEMIEIEYSLAHNIVFAGYELATEYHIPQYADFVNVTRYLLEDDDDKIPLIEIHTGDENGLPHLLVNTENKQLAALAQLKKYAGEGKFTYTVLEEDDDDELENDEDVN